MGFVVIVEPDEVNAQRINTILESVIDRDFEYELTKSPERGIELFEEREVDIFIGDMEMPIISAAELFSMIGMMSPDTVPMVMTDANKVKETIEFMNQCHAFKLIIKPCRIADDIVTPIEAAFAYKRAGKQDVEKNERADAEYKAEQKKCATAQQIWKENEKLDQRIAAVYSELLSGNIELSSEPQEIRELLKSWFTWTAGEYTGNMLMTVGNYRESDAKLTKMYDDPEEECSFRLRRSSAEPIEPQVMRRMTYLITVLCETCKRILVHYDITVLILTMKEAHIMRFRCTINEKVYRMTDKTMRGALMDAAKYCVEAMGCQYNVQNKNCDYNINIVLPKDQA